MKKSIVLLLLVIFMAAPAIAIDAEYTLGTDDILDISILQPEKMMMTVTIAPDGTITFPYIGNVKVKDMTLAAAQELIQSRLADGYMKYPIVAVSLREVRSKKLFVYGEVLKPGTYSLTDKKTTVLNAIIMAGGFTKAGAAGSVKVLRPKKDGIGSDTIDIDIKAATASSTEADVVLQPEDTVVVTEAKYFVYGDVMRSGGYPLEEDTAVLKAISTAGGFIKYGAMSRVKILRPKKGGGPDTIDVDVKSAMSGSSKADIMLQAGDTVVVSEEKYFVYGEVVKPGVYSLEENTTVLKAISIAGGFGKFGSSSRVKILRTRADDSGNETIKVDMKAALGGTSVEEAVLKSGDTVVVEEGIF